MAGTGSNSTREAVELTQEAEKAGATSSLQVAPYYNKPTQEGLYQHFKTIAQNTALPIMLYSVPGRCGVEISVETVVRLAADCPNIRSIKEAGGNPERVSLMRQELPAEFEILSGDDSLTLPFMILGAVGVVSVASNIIPAPLSQMVQQALKGQWAEAQAIHYRYYPLFSAFLKLAPNPIPIKAAMGLMNLIDPELRSPMTSLPAASTAELKAMLQKVGLV
jgi:4-hydroxy-tetrahydrodipicolinate synthase